MNQQREFDYKGHDTKKSYYLDRVKGFLGKGETEDQRLARLEKIHEYYKNHPKAIINKGKSETTASIKRKLKEGSKKPSKIESSARQVDTQFKKMGTTYRPGKIQKASTVTGALIAGPFIPVPVISQVAGASVAVGGNLAGAAYDKVKLTKLHKANPKLKAAMELQKKRREAVKREEKRLTKLAKQLRKDRRYKQRSTKKRYKR